MRLPDFWKIKKLVKKTGIKLKVECRSGLPFLIEKARHRKMLVLGPCLCIGFLWIASLFLWSVEVRGNHQITSDMIGDFLHQEGIYCGIPLKQISISQLETDLRNYYDIITWASLNLEGTKLVKSWIIMNMATGIWQDILWEVLWQLIMWLKI